ncbi:MAG: hypothetical protein Ct9H300mP12_09380 [Acidimicrobiales bacterium]|nr:MAG: hypothetical protein Ct9H300mP12_09380 [Acidimicrobiales bacterium]
MDSAWAMWPPRRLMGPIALVAEGDRIVIDVVSHTID